MANDISNYHKKNKKFFPILVGKKVTLKPILDDEFYLRYYEWLRDPEIIKGIGGENMPLEEIIKLHSIWREDPSNLTLGIYEKTEKPIGDINLFDSEEFKIGPEIAIMVGARKKGFGKEALNLMIKYAFDSINVPQINLTVYKNNPALNLYSSLGFKIVGEKIDSKTKREEFEMVLKK